MSLRRTWVLLSNEFLHGARTYIFIFAVVVPLVLSFVVNLLFGTFLSEKAKLGVVDEAGTAVAAQLAQMESLQLKYYDSDAALRSGVENGSVDIGVVLPADIDEAAINGDTIHLSGYLWGESLTKSRMTIGTALSDALRSVAGIAPVVAFDTVTLGGEASAPWSERLLPFIVLMAVFLGGTMLPATAIIKEKSRKTINALLVSPVSISDLYAAKGTTGLVISLAMGIIILLINQAFGHNPGLLVLVLALGGLMAVGLGLLLGIFMKDVSTLFAVWKMGGIFLMAPVFIYMFPAIPEWVGRIFPTYYVIQPIMDISQGGGGWEAIALNVFILIGLDALLLGGLAIATRKTRQFAM